MRGIAIDSIDRFDYVIGSIDLQVVFRIEQYFHEVECKKPWSTPAKINPHFAPLPTYTKHIYIYIYIADFRKRRCASYTVSTSTVVHASFQQTSKKTSEIIPKASQNEVPASPKNVICPSYSQYFWGGRRPTYWAVWGGGAPPKKKIKKYSRPKLSKCRLATEPSMIGILISGMSLIGYNTVKYAIICSTYAKICNNM